MRSFVLFLLLFALSCAGCSKGPSQPIFGRDPVLDVTVHERQSDLLLEWCKRGYRKKVLLHISPSADLEYIPEGNMDRIADLYNTKKIDELDRGRDRGASGLFSSRNVLYAAAHCGAIKEIYWVIPYKFAKEAGGGVAIKNFLKTVPSFYNHDEIEKMTLKGGCLVGKVNGVTLNVCSVGTLPTFKEPVVVSMSADFIRISSTEEATSSLRGMRMLLDDLSAREIQVQSLHMVRGVEEGTGQPVQSYIADEFLQIATNPQIGERDAAPPLWLARDTPENMLNGGERKLVRETVAPSLKEYPADHPLAMIDITAQLLMGDATAARPRAEKLCKETPAARNAVECQFLVQLGDMATESGTAAPDPFYLAALAARPQWPYALMHRASSLMSRGKYAEARQLLAELASVQDGFLLRLRRGDVEFQLGQQSEALKFYDQAKALYDDRVGIPVSKENALSLDRMTRLYTQAGRTADINAVDAWKKRMDTYRPGK
ncbi:MAG TPA: hypothetical protein VI298_09545 [Geobacteraceae bacterium]